MYQYTTLLIQFEGIMETKTLIPFDFSDAAYEQIVSVWNAVWPDEPSKVDSFKFFDGLREDNYWERLVVEENGRIVAYGIYGESWWSQREGKYYLYFLTLPEYRNQGLASAFYNLAVETITARGDLQVLSVDTREDMPQSIEFIKNRGFKQVMRYPRSIIDVQAFEPEKYADLIQKAEASGIELLNITQLAERYDDYQYRCYEMVNQIHKDIPSPDPFKEDPFEIFQKRVFERPTFLPEANFIAVDKDEFVAISSLWKTPQDEKLSTGLTGVLRSHRRKGLATALKAKALAYAKSNGVVEVDTDNEENNPMYQINMQLGFKPAPAYLDFQKEIEK